MTAQEELPFHFTDLLASADALIAKPGYGTFTEAACNGATVLYVSRNDWPEQPYLVDLVGPPCPRPTAEPRNDSWTATCKHLCGQSEDYQSAHV